MPKSKWNLNTIYISERLQESLRPISRCPLTTVVAPMGYGKTTAVNWYLEQRAKAEDLNVIRISVYSNNLEIFWKSVQNAFVRAGFDFLQDYTLPTDTAGGGLLIDDLCHELSSDIQAYIFIDDFHLLTDERVSDFLCSLANRMPFNVHIIVASRDRFLPNAQLVRLGSKVYQIGIEHLRLNYTELAIYAHKCGTNLSDEEIEALLYSSEGWFSAVYLNLRTLFEIGSLPDRNSDIYSTFTAAMIDPLPLKQQEFLAVMGLADEFTIEMATFVMNDVNAEKMLMVLTEQNAFVKCLPDGVTYRFHHMMKECAERRFIMLDKDIQKYYLERLGLWYENNKQYLHAISSYRRCENYDALFRVIQKDAGILLSSLDPKVVLNDIDNCPTEILKKHPLSILVLMRSMFNWRLIPKMMEMKALLMQAIDDNPDISKKERGDLLGESDLIMSFLCYNDISAMSRLHRSASSQMSRCAISIQNSGGWSFGSPSVLMMYYRIPGELDKYLLEMDECMPHYYMITNNHGQGAEKIMRAESYFEQGRFIDAHIELENAYSQIEGNGQVNMSLCCDFLACRLSLYTDVLKRYTFEKRREDLLHYHNSAWINIWSATSAYYHALKKDLEKIPAIFADHQLYTVNLLAPGKPMIEMIENQVYLAQNAYTKVIAKCQSQLPVCEAMHYALVTIHLCIQMAASYEMLQKHDEADKWLIKALNDAAFDNFIIPFAENYDYIKTILERLEPSNLITSIKEIALHAENRKNTIVRPMVFNNLTQREFEIVELMVKRLSNKEIAQKLYLSEGSVKQYANQIYSKLHIEGDIRTKRKQLADLFSQNT